MIHLIKSFIDTIKGWFKQELPKQYTKSEPIIKKVDKVVEIADKIEELITYDYDAVHCETGYQETVKSYSKLKKGTVFFMTNRDNTGCYSITSSSKTPGKRTLRKNLKTFASCEECPK
jgi:hypothetical protein